MQISQLRRIIADYKDDEHIAIKFYEKYEAEERYAPEDDEVDVNWEYIVQAFERDEELDDVASNCFDEAISFCLLSKRERDGN
jgi:hypothetical protein